MNTVISFTPAQLFAGILAVCGGFTGICVAVSWAIKALRVARSPMTSLEERVEALEEKAKPIETIKNDVSELKGKVGSLDGKLQAHDRYFRSDKRRMEAIEGCIDKDNQVILTAILALLEHGINGNDVEAMKKSKAEITNHLTSRSHFDEEKE